MQRKATTGKQDSKFTFTNIMSDGGKRGGLLETWSKGGVETEMEVLGSQSHVISLSIHFEPVFTFPCNSPQRQSTTPHISLNLLFRTRSWASTPLVMEPRMRARQKGQQFSTADCTLRLVTVRQARQASAISSSQLRLLNHLRRNSRSVPRSLWRRPKAAPRNG